MTIYRGWIPTVSGRLSFSLIGERSDRGSARGRSIKYHDDRFVVSEHRRDLLDWALPKFVSLPIARNLLGHEGRFHFLTILRQLQNDNGEKYLSGVIFVFTGKEPWHSEIREKTTEILLEMKAFEEALDEEPEHTEADLQSKQEIRDNIEVKMRDLVVSASKVRLFRTRVVINRNGHTTLLNGRSSRKDIRESKAEGGKGLTAHGVCSRECFYFIKDISHAHQHHDSHDDSVCRVYPIANEDDPTWAVETLRAMYKKVLVLKRNRGMTASSEALGILAYANSFADTYGGNSSSFNLVKKAVLSKSLRLSIEAKKEEQGTLTNKRVRLSSITTTIFSIIIALFALNMTFFSTKLFLIANFLKDSVNDEPELKDLLVQAADLKGTSETVSFILSIQHQASFLLILCLVFFGLLAYYGGQKKVPLNRLILKMLHGIDLKWNILVAIAAITLSLYVLSLGFMNTAQINFGIF